MKPASSSHLADGRRIGPGQPLVVAHVQRLRHYALALPLVRFVK